MLFDDYEEARFKFIELQEPVITTSYEMKYDYVVGNISNKTEKLCFDRLKTIDALNYFYNVLAKVSERLDYYERCYLVCCLLKKQSEDSVSELLQISKTKFNRHKKSCVIKCGLAFGVAEPIKN